MLNFVNRDSGVPNFPLLPRVAWEKVPEGRMRALCSSSINMSDSFCYKNPPRRSAGRQEEPSPGLRPPSPIASRRARGKPQGSSRLRQFSPDSPACEEGLGVGVARCTIILHDEKWRDHPTPTLDPSPQGRENMTFNAGGHVA